MNELTIKNCKDYLESMYFTDIQFSHESAEGFLYFTAIDEDDTQKEIEFAPENEKVICSVKENDQWNILEILRD